MDCVLAETGTEPSLLLLIVGVVAAVTGAVLLLRGRGPRLVRSTFALGAILLGAAAFTGLAAEPASAAADCPPAQSQAQTPAPAETPSPSPSPSETPITPLVIDGEVTAAVIQTFDQASGVSTLDYTGSFGPSAASTAAIPAGSTVEFTIVNHEINGDLGTGSGAIDPRLTCTPSSLPTSLNAGGVFEETVVVSCQTTAALNPGDAPAGISLRVSPSHSGSITSAVVTLPSDADATNNTRSQTVVGP